MSKNKHHFNDTPLSNPSLTILKNHVNHYIPYMTVFSSIQFPI